jgi:hypothetical protein
MENQSWKNEGKYQIKTASPWAENQIQDLTNMKLTPHSQ